MLQKTLKRRGAAGQQYAIMVGLIAVVAILAIASAGSSVNRLMARTANTMSSAANGVAPAASGGGGGGGPTSPPLVAGPYTVSNITWQAPLAFSQSGVLTAVSGGSGSYQITGITNGSNCTGFTFSNSIQLLATAAGASCGYQVSDTVTGATANGTFTLNGSYPDNCAALKTAGPGLSDGTYTINAGGTPFSAYCDMTTMGGGWTLFSQSRPVNNSALSLTASGAVGTLELNDTTITAPAKYSDTIINLIAPGREIMQKSRYEGYGSATISAFTDICRINLKDTVNWNSASNTPIATANLDSTTLVCSQNANVTSTTLATHSGGATNFTYALGLQLTTTSQWFLYTADTSYSGGNCGAANAGRSWLGPGNYGCNAVKWYGR